MEKSRFTIPNNFWIFAGLLVLAISIIICTSLCLGHIGSQQHIVNGSLGLSQVRVTSESEEEHMPIGDVMRILGYDTSEALYEDIGNNKLRGLPYIKLNGDYYFSRESFQEWFVEQTRKQTDFD